MTICQVPQSDLTSRGDLTRPVQTKPSAQCKHDTHQCVRDAEPPLRETVADYVADGRVIYSRWNVTHEEYEAEKKRDKKCVRPAHVLLLNFSYNSWSHYTYMRMALL